MRYITLISRIPGVYAIITDKEWREANHPLDFEEWENWRMIHDPDVRARFEAEECAKAEAEEIEA